MIETHSRPLILVSTGTDKRYPFARLVTWTERWVADHADEVELILQSGITRSRRLPSVSLLAPDELDQLLDRANAVVLQGGPGGIVRARQRGVVPIVVPRRADLGEAVDDHQLAFARWAADRSWIVEAQTRDLFTAALERVLIDPFGYRIDPEPSHTNVTVRRFGDRMERLLHDSRGRRRGRGVHSQ
jgi:UDP-N-acetylglucosamine transferase subunit ALG13